MGQLNDLDHYWGNDIAASPTGDLGTVDSVARGQQRILRRLLTNPGDALGPPDYPFHPEYGAGLPRLVGTVTDLASIKALIRGQILLEDSVARLPEPDITVNAITGGVSVYIRYTDAASRTPATLSFSVNR